MIEHVSLHKGDKDAALAFDWNPVCSLEEALFQSGRDQLPMLR